MAPFVIAVIGYINMDLSMVTSRVPDLGESLQARGYSANPGGKASNAAVAAFRSIHEKIEDEDGNVSFNGAYNDANIEVRIIGAVGPDSYGVDAIKNLKDNGVNTDGVRIVNDQPTGVCFITVEDKSRDIRALFYTGATSSLLPRDFPTAESIGAGVRPNLIVSQLEARRDTVEHVMKLAYDENIDFVLNAAPAQVLLMDHYQYITHLIVNETEAATLSGIGVEDVKESTWAELAEDFLELGVKNVVITLGADGAFYANKHGGSRVPAEKVKVVDAAGAGDTFVGVYACDYLRQKARNEWDIRGAVARANRAAAHTVGKMGAQSAIPWAYEIDQQPTPLSQSISSLSMDAPNGISE